MKLFSQNKELFQDDVVELSSIYIEKKVNSHSHATILLALKDWDYEESLEKMLYEHLTVENDTTILFSGIVQQIDIAYFPHGKVATLHIVSLSIFSEEDKFHRVFQSTSKKIADIFQYVSSKSEKQYAIEISSECNPEIPDFIVQSNETDFDFIVRISKKLGCNVFVSDNKREQTVLFVGNNTVNTPIILDEETLSLHSTKLFKTQTFHLVEYAEFLLQGDTVLFQGKKFVVLETYISYDRHITKYLYLLCTYSTTKNEFLFSDTNLYDLGRCKVISHEDPQRMGRLQVQFLDYQDALTQDLPWISYLPNVTEKEAGFICYPHQGEIVRVFCQKGSAFVLGCQREIEISTDFDITSNYTLALNEKKIFFSEENLLFQIENTKTSWSEKEITHSSENFILTAHEKVKIDCSDLEENAAVSMKLTSKNIKETVASTSIEKNSSEVIVKSGKISLNKIEIK